MSGQVTDVEEVFLAGAHCGTVSFSYPQWGRCLLILFCLSDAGVVLWKTVNAIVSPAFPSDG